MIKLKDLLLKESPDGTISPRRGWYIAYDNMPNYTFIMNDRMAVTTKSSTRIRHYDLMEMCELEYKSEDNQSELLFVPDRNIVYGELRPYGAKWVDVESPKKYNLRLGRIFPEDDIICFWDTQPYIAPCLNILDKLMSVLKLNIDKFVIEYYTSGEEYKRSSYHEFRHKGVDTKTGNLL